MVTTGSGSTSRSLESAGESCATLLRYNPIGKPTSIVLESRFVKWIPETRSDGFNDLEKQFCLKPYVSLGKAKAFFQAGNQDKGFRLR